VDDQRLYWSQRMVLATVGIPSRISGARERVSIGMAANDLQAGSARLLAALPAPGGTTATRYVAPMLDQPAPSTTSL
jgi:hypothetical protein